VPFQAPILLTTRSAIAAAAPLLPAWTPLAAGLASGAATDAAETAVVQSGWLPGVLFLATFASEDLACVTAGVLVAQGSIGFVAAFLSCAAGILLGDLGLYWIGRGAALGLLRWRWARERLPNRDGSSRWARALERHGTRIVFTSRFVPGSRLPVFVGAGALGWPFGRFAGILLVAALIWTPFLVFVSTLAGEAVGSWLETWGGTAWLAVPVLLLAAWALSRVASKLSSWRGRRELYGSWRRLVAWEYWPMQLVYAPVAIWLALLALRYRAVAAFTACNPGIPLGGMALESKGAILAQMPRTAGDDAPVRVASFETLARTTPLAERLERVAVFVERAGPASRVVLKPDVGERGEGVAIVRDLEHARRWLAACPGDAIVQEFVDGPEYGIVWWRDPADDDRGKIRSIAHKVPPTVTGDGERPLLDLILADRRHVAMLRVHRRRLAGRLDEVPAPDETVVIGELGTHCRGAAFLDARALWTEELERALDAFLAESPGLDFGRFDVRATSEADLRAGRGVRVIEFNGVTGEPAHVYQPGYPLWRGIYDLCAHWAAACRRGAANRTRGARAPATVAELLELVRAVRARPSFEAPPANAPSEGPEHGRIPDEDRARSPAEREGTAEPQGE
jgi:membrane protein DedA with SNARE-associated domain